MRDDERSRLLTLCRAAMPHTAGVVLSTLAGGVVAHEPRVADPHDLARDAATARHAATSAMVERPDGLYLVMFVRDV